MNRWNSRIRASLRELSVLCMVLVIYLAVCLIEPRFLSSGALINIFLFFPYLLLIALGEMIEVIGRNVDLSLGAILAFSGYAVGRLFVAYPGFPIPLAFGVAVAVGALLGFVNGWLVNRFQIPSVIVTLGTMNVYRGLIFILGGRQIDNSHIPQALVRLSQPGQSAVGVPYSVIIALACAALVALFLRRTRPGREIYAAGSNPQAADLRGIRLARVRITVFVLAGALSGLASMIYISRVGYLDPGMAGKGLEFIAIAAVVIGGTSMNGGVGTTLGTVIGCLLLGVINNAISITGVSGYWQEAIYGLIIVASVVADNGLRARLSKTAKGGKRHASI